ncbi:glycosyltransferase family 2 protein [Cohnella rhizosphaerae]|uniref:Glycosyltransferase family 2 protein n=1 Tax=Cohnella rhizosphaerae TaxID=1457232 RepID=A0A9X4QVU0_9BACL|nr:glycosyltransferase family A protein [Cohnella rhizosphaerae]MDG0811812.1 glycosyltransferase family 2 protein [Cohnella rhizosphaerae]
MKYFRSLNPDADSRASGKYITGLVSVVIPCFNHGSWLQQTLDSIHASTYPSIEILIVNDGSTDEKTIATLKEIEEKGFKVIHQNNGGLSQARNTGVHHAKGEFILPLDADDLIHPDYIKKSR